MLALRTWKRSKRKAKHLTARERRLLLLYDQALARDEWRDKEDRWPDTPLKTQPTGRVRPVSVP